jgi:hypothetical protein
VRVGFGGGFDIELRDAGFVSECSGECGAA